VISIKWFNSVLLRMVVPTTKLRSRLVDKYCSLLGRHVGHETYIFHPKEILRNFIAFQQSVSYALIILPTVGPDVAELYSCMRHAFTLFPNTRTKPLPPPQTPPRTLHYGHCKPTDTTAHFTLRTLQTNGYPSEPRSNVSCVLINQARLLRARVSNRKLQSLR
jgi:hypothetical protein